MINVVAGSSNGESAFFESLSPSPLSDFRDRPYQSCSSLTSVRTPRPHNTDKPQELFAAENLDNMQDTDFGNNHVSSSRTPYQPLNTSNVLPHTEGDLSSYAAESSALFANHTFTSPASVFEATTSQPSTSAEIGSKPSTSSIKISKSSQCGRSVSKAKSSRAMQQKIKLKGIVEATTKFRYTSE